MSTLPSQPNCTDFFDPRTISVTTALNRILDRLRPVKGCETVSLDIALNRVLAEPLVSSFDVPLHTNAAVDGFAIRSRDLPPSGQTAVFQVIGEALAGHPFSDDIAPDQSVAIMTGAPLPDETDTILMQEHVKALEGNRILVGDRHHAGENVRRAGEDIRQGETVLKPGRLLTPADLGLIASLGIIEIKVKRKLKIAVLSTGDEILPQGVPRKPGKLYDSNRFSLMAVLRKLPVEILDYGIVPDDPSLLRQAFEDAIDRSDVIISSGGVSVGEADYTQKVLAELGTIDFWKVAIKPGRPLAFGQPGNSAFFGLPGNPVAVMVTYYRFVLPALYHMAGTDSPPLIPAFPARTVEALRKKPGRTEFQRGILSVDAEGRWQVETTGQQGSGILSSMSLANCFIVLEHERARVEAGETVTVWPFSALM
ncbi:molybdopterin molybdotransferase MoeA [Methylohalobius crimeensis]|uniref:molybdopterin molybdotransferase MoeA n=1 Tax=Methylohalobius crimeensis TaxID=244365 RepID=UPI0003B315DB|nr:gephyrin-like molybdotransferase Glp [Methylohalobius crimeensis]